MSSRVVLAYKNFAANRNISHIGLGVSALNTAKVLRKAGIVATVVPILSASDLHAQLATNPTSHVVVCAPWIPTADMQKLSNDHSETHFFINCHSNVGFLQADRNGVKLIRETMELELATHNVHLAGNCTRFVQWINSGFARPCTHLPNLYWLDEHVGHAIHPQPIGHSGPLRIGIFGATRPLKNLMTAAAAAVSVSRSLRLPLELWLSAGRAEGGGQTVLDAVREMIANLPSVSLELNGWQTWPQFRQTVAHMHLLLQPSYTESFNMVTADGVAEGVPSVVSDAIDWAPAHWRANVDDSCDVARVARQLLHDAHAASEGLRALKAHVAAGLSAWKAALA